MKIKCLLTLVALSLAICVPAQAQDDEIRHEVSVSYGLAPNSGWLGLINDALNVATGDAANTRNTVGPIGLEYIYRINPRIGVGLVGTFYTNKKDTHAGSETGTCTRSFFTAMPAVKFNWLRRANWGLYSKAAIGATFNHDKYNGYKDGDTDNSVTFNFQASLIGIEGGGTHVRAFAEAGMGEQGVLLGGVRFRF